MKTALHLLACSLALVMAGTAHAEDEAIATDRPDFVESSDVVGKGRIQVETSLAWERDRAGGLRTRTASTPTLLRVGLTDTWELRFETDGRLRQRVQAATTTERLNGWADVAVGAKWHQADGDEESGRPGLAWLLHFDTASGSGAFRGQGVRPSLRFVAEWELPAGWSLGVMPGLYRERDDQGRRYTGGLMAVVVGKSLTERWRAFVELAGREMTSRGHGGNVFTVDGGVAFQLTRDLQLDAALSRGINGNAPDMAWTVGLSSRF